MDRSKWNTELVVAVSAVAIGVCTMLVYIYQARIMSKQMHAAVWPFIQTNLSETNTSIVLKVNNKGVGPAIVKKAFVIVNGERYADTQANLDSVGYKLTGKKGLLNGYTNIEGRVISANEEIRFIEISDSVSLRLFKQAMSQNSIRIEICYCSVYNDCWKVTGATIEACDSCAD